MKLGDRVEYHSRTGPLAATIIGELEREFVIRTDQLCRDGFQINWTYHLRIPKHQAESVLAPLPRSV